MAIVNLLTTCIDPALFSKQQQLSANCPFHCVRVYCMLSPIPQMLIKSVSNLTSSHIGRAPLQLCVLKQLYTIVYSLSAYAKWQSHQPSHFKCLTVVNLYSLITHNNALLCAYVGVLCMGLYSNFWKIN